MTWRKPNASDYDRADTGERFRQSENTRVLSMLAQDYLKERKSKRRWGIFFKSLFIIGIGTAIFAHFKPDSGMISGEHTALVELEGIIGPNSNSARAINHSLADAFAAENSVGVILQINSPGGAPVQAAQINEEITRLKALYPDKPFYVSIMDICTSGGYYVAVAADRIFAHPSSIVGSIGVLMGGFGFVEAMDKLGIERRLITAGANKAILDPFSPSDRTDVEHARAMLAEVHEQFVSAVKSGRGDRLQNDPQIFSGLFWSGASAMKLGLIDQFASSEGIARDVIGAEKLVNYTLRASLLDELTELAGASIVDTLMSGMLRMW